MQPREMLELEMKRGRAARMWSWIWEMRWLLLVMGMGIALSDVAFAQDLEPVNDIADYLQNFLTGRLATSLAVIAVAVVGYLFWAGQIAAQAALSVVAGIALVFGSAQIVAILEAVAQVFCSGSDLLLRPAGRLAGEPSGVRRVEVLEMPPSSMSCRASRPSAASGGESRRRGVGRES